MISPLSPSFMVLLLLEESLRSLGRTGSASPGDWGRLVDVDRALDDILGKSPDGESGMGTSRLPLFSRTLL